MTTLPTSGPYQIQRLLPRHFKMLEMRLAGCTNVEIAQTLDCTKENVYAVSRSPMFISEFNRRMKDQIDDGIQLDRAAFMGKARSILDTASLRAAETQLDLLESDDDSVRLRASGTILDRALGKPESKTSDSGALSVMINAPDAQLLIIALKESNNAQVNDPTANGSSASPTQNKQADVHQTPCVRPWFRHRTPQAQNPEAEVISVVDGVG